MENRPLLGIERLVTDQNYQWDFAVTTGMNVALAVCYLVQCVRRNHMPCETRNKLTMTIWWSIFFNLVALLVKNIIMLNLRLTSKSVGELSSYGLNSTACFFFTNAIMLQTFEWDILGSMIKFQAEHCVNELNVVKDTYNALENKKLVITKYVVWGNIAYHLVKIIVPGSTLVNCFNLQVDSDYCESVTEHRI